MTSAPLLSRLTVITIVRAVSAGCLLLGWAPRVPANQGAVLKGETASNFGSAVKVA